MKHMWIQSFLKRTTKFCKSLITKVGSVPSMCAWCLLSTPDFHFNALDYLVSWHSVSSPKFINTRDSCGSPLCVSFYHSQFLEHNRVSITYTEFKVNWAHLHIEEGIRYNNHWILTLRFWDIRPRTILAPVLGHIVILSIDNAPHLFP